MKKILYFILLFAFSFGIECYAGSPFLPYKQNGSFYSKSEIISAYTQKEIYLERLAFRIEQVARHDGWADQIQIPVSKSNALYFLNRMEEGTESWASGDYEVDHVDGTSFGFVNRSSHKNRSTKELGPEGVLFLDPAKVGIKGNFPRRSLIARVCGNTKSGIPTGSSLQEDSPLVSSPMMRSAPAPSEQTVNLNTTQSDQVWVKQAPQVIPVYSAKQQNQNNTSQYYYEDRTSGICCNQGAVNVRTTYNDISNPYGCGNNWGGYPWVMYGGRGFCSGGFYGTNGSYPSSGWYGGNSYQTTGFYNSGGWYGGNSYPGNGGYNSNGNYGYNGSHNTGGGYTTGSWYGGNSHSGNGGHSGSGGYSGNGGNVIVSPRGPR